MLPLGDGGGLLLIGDVWAIGVDPFESFFLGEGPGLFGLGVVGQGVGNFTPGLLCEDPVFRHAVNFIILMINLWMVHSDNNAYQFIILILNALMFLGFFICFLFFVFLNIFQSLLAHLTIFKIYLLHNTTSVKICSDLFFCAERVNEGEGYFPRQP